MRNEKIKAFVQHILQECEKEGLNVWEVERLPQALKFAITDSVNKQMKSTEFNNQIPNLTESHCNESNSHL